MFEKIGIRLTANDSTQEMDTKAVFVEPDKLMLKIYLEQ